MSGDALLNNRYRLIAQQGSGGMAVIYKAIDESLGRTVAVKILRPSLTTDTTFVTRFQNEARSIANLAHPNIVTVHDVGHDLRPEGTTYYIVMEFVDGRDLKKVIREYNILPLEYALEFAISMCAGLGFAHRAKLVHADVKPQNLLVTQNNQLKITDFGIAQAMSETQPKERQDVVWGSPHYFSPEQAQGESPTAASDVYSIGIVMFEMLTGQLPYTGTNQQELALAHIRTPIPLANERNPNIPSDLAKIVHKVMSKKPSDRYSMAGQLGHILITYRDQMKARRTPEEVATPPSPPTGLPAAKQQPPAQSPLAQRPQTLQPAQSGPSNALPTQPYNPAPEASPPAEQRQPAVPQPRHDAPHNTPPPMAEAPYQARIPHHHLRESREEGMPFTLDKATVALAFLALTSVSCLIPLYIAVWIART
jgi:eukaryotic-like serine/threonine-protein kinase